MTGMVLTAAEPVGAPVASGQMRDRPLSERASRQVTPGALSVVSECRCGCGCVGGWA
jgi:hypothetical protein